ncbi:hypothetical protein D6C80_00634 [Aureobasidium pullulans]|nr:hypothetical protein D6C80_00634 [Aureobasidium pullulans]
MITLVSRTALLVRVDSSDRKIEKGHCGDEECEPHGMRTEKVRFRDGEAEIQTGVRPFISDARQQAAAMITWWISVEIAVATRKRRSTLSRETGSDGRCKTKNHSRRLWPIQFITDMGHGTHGTSRRHLAQCDTFGRQFVEDSKVDVETTTKYKTRR